MTTLIKLLRSSFGLGLLYASAYYLPQVGTYWLPNDTAQILYPSVVAVLVLTPLLAWFQYSAMHRKRMRLVVAAVTAILCFIGFLGLFSAAGYSALNFALGLFASTLPIQMTRWLRVELVGAALLGLFIAVTAASRFSDRILRFLSILGYAFAFLLVTRLQFTHHAAPTPDAHISHLSSNPGGTVGSDLEQGKSRGSASRRVVWIILDEFDCNLTLGGPFGRPNAAMPNLARLTSISVSARNAYSPAKDTVASIPSLLTGYPLRGLDLQSRSMRLNTVDSGYRVFQETDSIFGRLPNGPQSAAILGFYHPYCAVFPSVDPCLAWPEANVGRWFDALTFFGQPMIATARGLPGSGSYLAGNLFKLFEPMYRISADTIREFPKFVAREDRSLIFIHVNLPHPPGDYSQRALGLKRVGNDHSSYQNNLVLADQLIGVAMTTLNSELKDRDTLLIISSDHWLRMDSPSTAQRIPWIAWHVGESAGLSLEKPINSVHTSELILAFLRGEIEGQSEIVDWWNGKPFYYSLVPHGSGYQGYGS